MQTVVWRRISTSSSIHTRRLLRIPIRPIFTAHAVIGHAFPIRPIIPIIAASSNDSKFQSSWFHKCALFVTASTVALFLPQDSSQCCGIAGVIGTPDYDARYYEVT